MQPMPLIELGLDAFNRMGRDAAAYAVDAWQRHWLTLDVLRERGDAFIAHAVEGKPPLLKFEHQLLMDGRDLPRPCNYALLRIVPPPDVLIDAASRPIVIVDPRAGHGPGIGGFKPDSEVGVALHAGHAVYFVTFSPEPVDGQTLIDVAHAEAAFIEEVGRRHPGCASKPAVIGNCQAGWAIAALAAARGDIMGPIVLNGAPLSYWAGNANPEQNPMRYTGGLLGGAWLSAFTADLAGDRFDGAWLVNNFESLNPGNTLWGKLYNLYANVDTERERFLEFERWWGGYFRMTGEEIEATVENLFIGNRLAHGELEIDGVRLDMRDITAPMLIFASWGDNITPPQQALDWIIDVWGSERAIMAAGRTIVYMLHPSIGHLGIFVGGAVAKKEHDQIVNTLDLIDGLPPGLFEMKIDPKDAKSPFAELEPGAFHVRFENRTVDDIRALNADGRKDEAMFSTIAQWSEATMQAYRTWLQPAVKAMGSRTLGDVLRWLHPLRMQHLAFSGLNPAALWWHAQAEQAREHRQPVAADNTWLAWEHVGSEWIVEGLNMVGHWRDVASANMVAMAYGPQWLGAWLPPRQPEDLDVQGRGKAEEARARELALRKVRQGGFEEAVCRIVLADMTRRGEIDRRGLRLGQQLLAGPHKQVADQVAGKVAQKATRGSSQGHGHCDWHAMLDEQALIVAFAGDEALKALPTLLPGKAEREEALALAAVVLMRASALHDPDSSASQWVRERLDVDPAKVAKRARSLAKTVAVTSS